MVNNKKKAEKMKIALASDHAGFKAKEEIKKFLLDRGYEVKDFGCFSEQSVDYPDFIFPAAKAVASKEFERGVFFCGSGNGANIVANKVKGLRAAVGYNEDVSRLAAEDTACRAICFGARFMKIDMIKKFVDIFLSSPQAYEERHLRRVKKIEKFENVSG